MVESKESVWVIRSINFKATVVIQKGHHANGILFKSSEKATEGLKRVL